MIVSASRRTDIPALYSKWFMNRIRAGWCSVPNPFDRSKMSTVLLGPSSVDAIVFWSKNPYPILEYLDELDELGFRYYFQFTLNDYSEEFEPRIPDIVYRLNTFLNLSNMIGSLRVIWRYDPIIISNVTDSAFHIRKFRNIAKELQGATSRVMVSIVDFYPKIGKRIQKLEQDGFVFDRRYGVAVDLLKELAAIAVENGMQIFSCAEEVDFSQSGILPGACIDAELINTLWPLSIDYKKDPGQRKHCLCSVSKDIGVSCTCTHGCFYCYATSNYQDALRHYRKHDPKSLSL